VEIEGPEVESWAHRVAADAGFTNETHTLAFSGPCSPHAGR
jgi:Fe2+ or Zn2+ uptake regulation protein